VAYIAARYGCSALVNAGNVFVLTWWIGPRAYGAFITAVGITTFLSSIARVGLRVAAVVAVLLIVVGIPTQFGTMIGIVGAGLTVALKDFIVAFFGWLMLMGRNGIRLGDWVEINGVPGEVLSVGLFRTTLLETGGSSEKGHQTGRPTGRTTTMLNLLLYGPMIVPPVIYGVGIFRLWADLGALDTFPGVLVVHVVLGLPFVVVTVGATLATIDRRMAQAARSLGASPLQSVRRVILPNIVPGSAVSETGARRRHVLSAMVQCPFQLRVNPWDRKSMLCDMNPPGFNRRNNAR